MKLNEEKIQAAIKSGEIIEFKTLFKKYINTPEKLAQYKQTYKEIMEENARELRLETARKIKKARKEASFTQDQLAKQLKTSKSYISAIESGRQNVSVEYVVKIAQALNKQVRIEIY